MAVNEVNQTERSTQHSIETFFLKRWSPRAFTGEKIPDDILMSCFEAAHWAPSNGNSQPWRFVYSHRGSESWETFLGFLDPGNQIWAKDASALICIVSKRHFHMGEKRLETLWKSFDCGSAWMSLAIEAFHKGWHTHGMVGFDKQKIRDAFRLTEEFEPEVMIAIGKRAEKTQLPPHLQAREFPNHRKDLHKLVADGSRVSPLFENPD